MKVIKSRRNFVEKTVLTTLGISLQQSLVWNLNYKTQNEHLGPIHVFSKHLQFLNYKDMADWAASLGFEGVELTVRPGGHVEPEKATDQLPIAIEAIKNAGLLSNMVVSAINHAETKENQNLLWLLSELGVEFYRLGYFHFPDDRGIPQALADYNHILKNLAATNHELHLTGAYQNHAGQYVGAQIWDIWHLLEEINSADLGCQYDIRHATVEGGESWEKGFDLIRNKISSIVLKDFLWKQVDGKWRVVNVPLGEGMVDFESYFKLLKKFQISCPVSIHFEYDLGGAEHGAKHLGQNEQTILKKAMVKDLDFVKEMWKRIDE